MRPRSPVPALSLGEVFSRGLDSPAADQAAVLLLAADLPPDTDPLDVWVALPGEFGVFWETAVETIASVGICLGIDPAGNRGNRGNRGDRGDRGDRGERLGRVETAVRLPTTDFPTDDAPAPRLLGSVLFAPGWVDERWTCLSNPGFVLPRWTVFRTAGRAMLQLAVEGPIDDSSRAAIEKELASIERVLCGDSSKFGDSGKFGASSECGDSGKFGDSGVEQPWVRPLPATIPPGQDSVSWEAAVESAVSAIHEGHLQKVVLSRYVTHKFPDPVSPIAVLRHLSESGAGRYRFGLRSGDTAFVGASPECLFDKRGAAVEVEALAGTFDLAGDGSVEALIRATEHLFASGKDLEEHGLVVRGILDALAPLSTSVSAADWPLVREARGLAHLSTDVIAQLRPGVTPWALIDALHPTPAVGGLPGPAALEFIRRVEPEPRGLFAAPVGWISPTGDACLAVAIRSALLVGNRARVYAGAGIVAASESAAEWAETAAKLRWLGELDSGSDSA